MYKKVELKDGFVGMENDVAKLWKEKDIAEDRPNKSNPFSHFVTT